MTGRFISKSLSNGEVSVQTKASARILYFPGETLRVSQSKDKRYSRSPGLDPQVKSWRTAKSMFLSEGPANRIISGGPAGTAVPGTPKAAKTPADRTIATFPIRIPIPPAQGVPAANSVSAKLLFHPENDGCLHEVCGPFGFPEKHENIPGRILDGLNESNVNEEV
jgi:hypothetical protein